MDTHVTSVRALDDYELEVSFENGERRVFDVKPYLSRGVNDRRFANFHIHPGHFKIWLRIKPGSINNALGLTNQTQAAYTIRVSDDRHFNYVIDLLRQAYVRNK